MVRTSHGPAERSKPQTAAEKPTAKDRQAQSANQIDPDVWSRIVEMGKSQQIDPSEVVRRAIAQVYGEPATTGSGYHSGMPGDPALTAAR